MKTKMIKKKCHFLVCTVKLDPHTDAIIDILEKWEASMKVVFIMGNAEVNKEKIYWPGKKKNFHLIHSPR